MGNVTINFLNNGGGGFAEPKTIPAGTTVDRFFASQQGLAAPENFNIRVNRDAVVAGYLLEEGDKLSITPKKIDGAS
jgi:hypothetical protein